MHLIVTGTSEYVSAGEWAEAAEWYGTQLLGKRLVTRIGLTIELKEKLRGRWGQIGCLNWHRPREFIIEIATYGAKRRKQLYTFGHEMVHLKQLARGELQLRSGDLLWKTKNAAIDDAWEEEPWEAEALGRERYLFEEFEARKK